MEKPVILKLHFHTVIITFDEEVGRVKAKLFPGGKEQNYPHICYPLR